MNKKATFAVVVICLLFIFFAGVTYRVLMLKPAATIKAKGIAVGEYDPALWGKSYPLQYRGYQKNLDMAASPAGFGGSEKIQILSRQPEMLINFKGMAFSIDYTEDRGHPYALDDLRETKRVNATTPGACMTCKTVHLIDIFKKKGWDYAKTPLSELFPDMKHPIVCATCHNPENMELRVINPAFIEAMQKQGIDVGKAKREEMRSYVCGQCHVEYYFHPETTKVILPWDKGFHPEQIYNYYSETPFGFAQDWIHPDSQAKMLKAQHPEFETWSNGVHGKAGVACADCHMPYMREKGQKYSSHWLTSPMRNIEASCGTCHDETREWMMDRVKNTQNNVWQMQRMAGQAIARAHEVIGKAGALAKANQGELEKAREFVRKAQWYWDFVTAENSMGFHNPVQVLNVLGQSLDLSHQAVAVANRAGGTNF